MSDSLRDQLLNAGFTESKPKRQTAKPQKSKPNKAKPPAKAKTSAKKVQAKQEPSASELHAIAEKKRIKAEIKSLIESAAAKDCKGEMVYSYILGSRVKQIFLTSEFHKKVSDKELVITRLNGNTYLIPPETGEKVLALNPDWAVIVASEESDPSTDTEYSDYQIPDDLHW